MSKLGKTSYGAVLGTALVAGGLLGLSSAQAGEVVAEGIDSEEASLRIVQLVGGLENPWGIAELPDGRFVVSERAGRMALINGGEVTHLDGVPEVAANGQGGLLDVTLHHAYDDGEEWIYFTYSKPGDGGTVSALARARLEGDALVDVEALFEQDRYSQPGRHYGSRLAWLPDGSLLMTVGDRGVDPERAQDAGDHAGTVLRLTETGGVPDDNPFVDDGSALDEIYSIGNRNIQGFAVDAEGAIWASEHGPLGGDELNLIEAGENYGWPTVSRGVDYSTREPIGVDSHPDMQDARYIYEDRFAPSGLAQVDSEAFAAWQGNLLAGGLRSEQLKRLIMEDGEVVHREIVLDGEIGRIREVHQGSDGYIYLLTDHGDGGLYRLEPEE
ncbi:Glucose/arabinose dehydrogenase, beta-propeller fold [Franzmannia pantelleriensis]|uniref:Glucose/arabinose dehydrogenase, beta-propeller fold n=1 Tax=Franzmannia pantelleriensis TaxID=48727 RepID=A0A1G9RDE6_9GAMM|nr:PQQ-dependent sugar dehydrogenase [Halomonas pantelleriensis]SDM21244.1 Glucose/arabinose dehydrogenase, beta-propeller fold [Halomonas pantelleriensis]